MFFDCFKITLLCGLLLVALNASPQTRARELARLEFVIDSAGKAYTHRNNTHAITMGIIEAGRTQAHSFGVIDPSDNRPADARTVFEIGPISQTITATLLAAYANKGYLDLESSILDYLPDTLLNNRALEGITLKSLANHTSGLPRMPNNFAHPDSLNAGNPDPMFPLDPVQVYSKEDLFRYLEQYTGPAAADIEYSHSDLGYALLGVILTQVSGKTFEEMLAEIFCGPLGLENTGSVPYADQDYAMSHLLSGETVLPGTYDALAGALGIKSSLRDLLLYVRAHFVLPESEVEHALSLTRQFTYYIPPETDLGLGWEMNLKQENLVYSYRGDARGSSTYLAFAPDGRKALIILSNAAEPVGPMGDAILEALLNVKPSR